MDARHDVDFLYSEAMFACCDGHFRYLGVVAGQIMESCISHWG